ncbi:MAG: hypothetical protein H0X37_22185 [Herpetosiphonaceae bacterium]|nr:hypothetical protein [Herpetosiphonaceae bacterium]
MSTGVYDSRLTAYFGDAVLQAGFMPLPHLFLRHYRELGLSHIQAMFVLQLMEIAWDLSRPPTSIAKLAARMGVGHRTIQVCSRELHALGLVDIYDQFDEAGAQVENGYDLSPLFRRLAAFAPVERPRGELRERRARVRTGETNPAPSVGPNIPPVQESAPASRTDLHPSSAAPCIPPPPHDSGLKAELKNLRKNPGRNQQEHQAVGGADTAPNVREQGSHVNHTGYSLRWETRLDADDIRHSRAVLDLVGLNANVAAAAAPTLHPAESWALLTYARGAGLGPGWVASQVYDFGRQQPQRAALARRYDAAGQALATLVPTVAEAVLDAAERCCPHDLPAAHAALGNAAAVYDVQCALTAVWSVMAEQRSQRSHGDSHQPTPVVQLPGRSLPFSELGLVPAADPGERTVLLPQADATSRAVLLPELWDITLREVQPQVTQSEWDTWLRSTVLLDVDDSEAIIGTPNIFVRQEVEQRYAEVLQSALQAALCRQMHINVVIAGGAQ